MPITTPLHWLLQRLSDVPPSDDWLSMSERETLARLRAPKRRRDWRLGRWTAKRALVRAGMGGLTDADPCSWRSISVRATEAGVPYALLGETEADVAISLSHSGEYGLCAVADRPAIVGCDLETIGRRGEEFVVDWFTETERRFVDAIGGSDERSRIVTLIWSAKESALKALGVGLRLDTREVEVAIEPALAGGIEADAREPGDSVPSTWRRLAVRTADRTFHGWWRWDPEAGRPESDVRAPTSTVGPGSGAAIGRIITVVADPSPGLPVAL